MCIIWMLWVISGRAEFPLGVTRVGAVGIKIRHSVLFVILHATLYTMLYD